MANPRFKTDLASVPVLDLLERLQVEAEARGDSDANVKCPSPEHDDETASCGINLDTGLWRCRVASCGAKGDIASFTAHMLQCTRTAALVKLADWYDLDEIKQIDSATVQKMHERIFTEEAAPLLKELRARGVTDDMLRASRIGFHANRVTIPVHDKKLRVVDIRRYLPGAPGNRKMVSTKGHGGTRLYRVRDLQHDKVWICGGEIKALVVGELLKEHGVGAVASTAGEGSWKPEFSEPMRGKHVWVCMDVDDAGRVAARKIADELLSYAEKVFVVDLPLDRDVHPKGDVNDYVGSEGAGASELLRLMDLAEEHVARAFATDVAKGERSVKFRRLLDPSNVGFQLSFDATINGRAESPFLVPKQVDISCEEDQRHCAQCPVKAKGKDHRGFCSLSVPSSSQHLLSLLDANKRTIHTAVRDAVGIPRCKAFSWNATSHYRVLEAALREPRSLDVQTSADLVVAFMVDCETDSTGNVPFSMVGRLYPHPSTQRATLIVDSAERTEDGLDLFQPTKTELDELRVFQPREWTLEALAERLDLIYDDLSANVTKIYNRQRMHEAIDVTFFGPLYITWRGDTIPAWTSVVVLGESGMGKSQISNRLSEYYGDPGERADAKNLTPAGIIGGVDTYSSSPFISWGLLVRNDRTRVALEELKGIRQDALAATTDARSSGQARISKIRQGTAWCRTRMLALTNPVRSGDMRSYTVGATALKEVIKSAEDIRRVDLLLVVSEDQINMESLTPPEVAQSFEPELAHRLMLWVWHLDGKDCVIEEAAGELALQASRRLIEQFFVGAIPLVDKGTAVYKLLRVAAAIAGRTFSEENGQLLVRVCHVEYAEKMLREIYSDKSCRLDHAATISRLGDTLVEPDRVREYLTQELKYGKFLVQMLAGQNEVTPQDIVDAVGGDRDVGQRVVSFLFRHRAIKRVGRSAYVKTRGLVALIGDGSLFEDQEFKEEEVEF